MKRNLSKMKTKLLCLLLILSLTATDDLKLDEFPGVLFSCTPERLSATDSNGEKELFGGKDGLIFGGYIDSMYLADLNGDGLHEFCGTANCGSGVSYELVIIYDYANDRRYVLSDRPFDKYSLSIESGRLLAIQHDLDKLRARWASWR